MDDLEIDTVAGEIVPVQRTHNLDTQAPEHHHAASPQSQESAGGYLAAQGERQGLREAIGDGYRESIGHA